MAHAEELFGVHPGQQPGEAPTIPPSRQHHQSAFSTTDFGFYSNHWAQEGSFGLLFICLLPLWTHGKKPYFYSMDLLGCAVLNIKCKCGPRKVKIFHGVCKNMVDRLEKLLLSQANMIHAETSRSPLLNKVLSWSVMSSCELLHYLVRSVLMWLLIPLLAKLMFVHRSF